MGVLSIFVFSRRWILNDFMWAIDYLDMASRTTYFRFPKERNIENVYKRIFKPIFNFGFWKTILNIIIIIFHTKQMKQ